MTDAALIDAIRGGAPHIVNCLRRYRQWRDQKAGNPDPRPIADRIRPIGQRDMFAEMERNPFWYALRSEVRDVGWNAFVSGGMRAMHDIERQVDEAANDGEWSVSVLDKWWDGIGNWHA